MIPVLFRIGPFPIYSFGLMLGIGFLLGSYILALELKRKKLDPEIASTITILAVVFGIAGAKMLFLIEEWPVFIRNPLGEAFSPGGLTWYGGFILGMTAITIYIRRKKVPFLKIWDGLAMGLILAYGVSRIGCHLSGDGDYGFPTSLPWGTDYSHGTLPPSRAFAIFPEIASHYPGGIVPDTTPCHPTPIYEFLLGVAGFAVLWNLRKRPWPDGRMFMVYLMMSTVFRFAVEFLRLNPRLAWGLSEAQLIAIPLFLVGLVGMIVLDRRQAARSRPA
ncbi:MAG TPA: prolipoprotein diacylglyceryl transferase [Bacteroidota bacterium]|nr:prolipoprotein diacylglyceryl transferase [Bacteroidota bacterium]